MSSRSGKSWIAPKTASSGNFPFCTITMAQASKRASFLDMFLHCMQPPFSTGGSGLKEKFSEIHFFAGLPLHLRLAISIEHRGDSLLAMVTLWLALLLCLARRNLRTIWVPYRISVVSVLAARHVPSDNPFLDFRRRQNLCACFLQADKSPGRSNRLLCRIQLVLVFRTRESR